MADWQDRTNPVVSLKLLRLDNDAEVSLSGREAWTAFMLAQRGDAGISSLDHIGPRLSHYIYKLRGYGFAIETQDVPHKGAFPGAHGVYVMHTPVKVLEARRHGEVRNAA